MSYSINKAMAGGYRYEKLSQPWFVEPGSQPSEEHAQIDRGLWADKRIAAKACVLAVV